MHQELREGFITGGRMASLFLEYAERSSGRLASLFLSTSGRFLARLASAILEYERSSGRLASLFLEFTSAVLRRLGLPILEYDEFWPQLTYSLNTSAGPLWPPYSLKYERSSGRLAS
uniref:RUN domain-containing protein n=1 Tax=Macrostomum lignano TaxID=282301 RepID=A0A1I8FR37_9PLAT